MSRLRVVPLLAVLGTIAASAQEPTLLCPIVRASMFKNGLALIERRVPPVAEGVYRLDDVPPLVHGTLSISGAEGVSAQLVERQVQVPRGHGETDLQRDLAGRTVTILLQGVPEPVVGVVRRLEEEGSSARAPMASGRFAGGVPANRSRFLILDTESGEALVDGDRIVQLTTDRRVDDVSRRRAVLLLNVGGEAAGRELRIRYLTTGLSWAPSYAVDLLDDRRMSIRQSAIVRNEMGDLADTEMLLISGFPNVRFRHVVSPLSPETSWSEFFSQINQQPGGLTGVLANNAILSQQVSFAESGVGSALPIDLSAAPSGEGVDLHYQPIGKWSLRNNEAMHLDVATGETDYRRIVEWIVPDTRDAQGRRLNELYRNSAASAGEGDPWDALQFRNPLPLPMTTGPATITADGRFNGQTISYWVNRGEQTTLPVTKALSIRTLASENEQPDPRDVVYIAGNDFQRVRVEGTVSASNHRAEPVDLVIRRRFSGELLAADGDPATSLREEAVDSVNRRNELTWTLRLEPGEARSLGYEYRVLVDR